MVFNTVAELCSHGHGQFYISVASERNPTCRQPLPARSSAPGSCWSARCLDLPVWTCPVNGNHALCGLRDWLPSLTQCFQGPSVLWREPGLHSLSWASSRAPQRDPTFYYPHLLADIELFSGFCLLRLILLWTPTYKISFCSQIHITKITILTIFKCRVQRH